MQTILQNTALAVFDFDNTVADTFAPSPNGLDVHTAYDIALEQLFGEPHLLKVVGGLKNRAPTELVHDIVRAEPKLVVHAMRTYDLLRTRVQHLMPKGTGIPLVPIKGDNYLPLLGEMIVRLKLECLAGEVSPQWPRPFDGVGELFEELRTRKKKLALISSGHDSFIRSSFKAWGIQCPDIVLSDDVLRPLPGPIAQKSKPSKLLIHYLLMMAAQSRIDARWDQLAYFGDDLVKDGGLARNADIPFGWYNPAANGDARDLRPNDFVIRSWRDLSESLHS